MRFRYGVSVAKMTIRDIGCALRQLFQSYQSTVPADTMLLSELGNRYAAPRIQLAGGTAAAQPRAAHERARSRKAGLLHH